MRRWTPTEDAILQERPNDPLPDLARTLGRTSGAIAIRRHKLGICRTVPVKSRRVSSFSLDAIRAMAAEGRTAEEIGAALGASASTVRGLSVRGGILLTYTVQPWTGTEIAALRRGELVPGRSPKACSDARARLGLTAPQERWTPEEDTLLWSGPVAEIAAKVKRSPGAVRCRRVMVRRATQ